MTATVSVVTVVTGTGTGVGKTIVSAALCAVAVAAGRSTAYAKVAQTGVPGDLPDIEVVSRLAGPRVTVWEGARFPDPMSPEAAARARGLPAVTLADALAGIRALAATHEVVVVEGAGGLLVRYGTDGWTVATLAAALAAPVVVVAGTELGTLNALALTLEAITHRALPLAGVVLGAWPSTPGALDYSNSLDMAPIAATLPADAGTLEPAAFARLAVASIGPELHWSIQRLQR